MSWPHRRESVLFFAAAVLSQGLPVGCTPDAFPYTVVATPGDGNTTKEGNASNVAYTYSGSGFVPQGQFRSGYAQQCASGVTDTFVFCVGETESDVYSLTVYDTAVSALVVLVHDAPRYFDVGAGSGGEVFIAHHPGMLFVGVGTALFVVDVASPEDPTRMSASHFAVAQIVGVKCSGTHGGVHIAVHVVELDGVQENVHVYYLSTALYSNLNTIGAIPMNGGNSWDINQGVFAAVYQHVHSSARPSGTLYCYVANISSTVTMSQNSTHSASTMDVIYEVSILADGTIAVFNCGEYSTSFGLSVLQDRILKGVYGQTHRTIQNAKMVTVEGYVYLTLLESRTGEMDLLVLSTANATSWKNTVYYKFKESVQITFTQRNPVDNVVMLTVAGSLVCGCLLAVLALLCLERSKQSKDTTATNPTKYVFLVSNDVKRNSMWAEMPTASPTEETVLTEE